MTDLVTIVNNQPITSSRIVAEKFGKLHKNVIQAIENIKAENSDLTPCYFETSYQAGTGKHYKESLMNQKGFSILVMGFTGKKARQWQSDLYDAFESAVKELQRIEIERKSAEWLEIRKASILSNNKLKDTIQQVLIPLAREQGSTADDKFFYINYQRAVNKAAGIEPKSRDSLSISQLYEVDKIQDMAVCSIKGLAAQSEPYKKIYSGTKNTLENYAQLSFINQRFLG